MIEEVTNLSVHKFLAGHTGGEQQLGSMIDNNTLDMMIFLRDPQAKLSLDLDVGKIFVLCDLHNVPLATNLATAELLIKALERGDLEWREIYKH
jgi:methylglyoxal synthase